MSHMDLSRDFSAAVVKIGGDRTIVDELLEGPMTAIR